MQRLAFHATALLVAATLGCGDRRTNEVGGVSDTATAPIVTTPEPETPTGPRTYTFDERQEFTESIRQQLAGIDSEIDQLASQAKSRGGAVSDRALERIRASRQAVSRDLKRAETATAANWEQASSRVSRSVGSLEEAIEGAQPK
jgi:hypothetical protein